MPYVAGHGTSTTRRVIVSAQPSSGTARTLAAYAHRRMSAQSAGQLGAYVDPDYLGFSFGGLVKGVAKAVKKVASPIQKATAAVGHAAGTAVTSKVGQAVLGGALALTGVGILPAAAIFAGTKGIGTLIKPGGNLKGALTGAAQGAVEGAGSVLVGRAARVALPVLKRAAVGTVKKVGSVLGHGAGAAADVAGGAAGSLPDTGDLSQLPPVETIPDAPPVVVIPRPRPAPLPPPPLPEQPRFEIPDRQPPTDYDYQFEQPPAPPPPVQRTSTTTAQNTGQTPLDTGGPAQTMSTQTATQSAPPPLATAATSPRPFDASDASDSFATIQAQQQAQADEQAQADAGAQAAADKAAKQKKLIIAGGVLAGVAGVVLLTRKRRRGRKAA